MQDRSLQKRPPNFNGLTRACTVNFGSSMLKLAIFGPIWVSWIEKFVKIVENIFTHQLTYYFNQQCLSFLFIPSMLSSHLAIRIFLVICPPEALFWTKKEVHFWRIFGIYRLFTALNHNGYAQESKFRSLATYFVKENTR